MTHLQKFVGGGGLMTDYEIIEFIATIHWQIYNFLVKRLYRHF